MRIVHVTPFYHDGFGYHENLLPAYQRKQGHDVTIITSNILKHTGSGVKFVKPGWYQDGENKIIRLKSDYVLNHRFVYLHELQEILSDMKPEYIFHHELKSLTALQVMPYKKKNKNVFLAYDNHADWYNSLYNCPLIQKIYNGWIWRTALHEIEEYADIVFGVTPLRCLFAEKVYGVPKNKIRFLPLGVDNYGISNCLENSLW